MNPENQGRENVKKKKALNRRGKHGLQENRTEAALGEKGEQVNGRAPGAAALQAGEGSPRGPARAPGGPD